MSDTENADERREPATTPNRPEEKTVDADNLGQLTASFRPLSIAQTSAASLQTEPADLRASSQIETAPPLYTDPTTVGATRKIETAPSLRTEPADLKASSQIETALHLYTDPPVLGATSQIETVPFLKTELTALRSASRIENPVRSDTAAQRDGRMQNNLTV